MDASSLDFPALMPAVAEALLGTPQSSSGDQARYGRNGSIAVNFQKGVWFDHVAGEGGGVLELIRVHTGLCSVPDQLDWLRDQCQSSVHDPRPDAVPAGHASPATQARAELDRAGPARPQHPYLQVKGIDLAALPALGLKQNAAGELLIPFYDRAGALTTLQRIAITGEKRLKAGARKTGGRLVIPPRAGAPRGRIYCEGFATGCTVWAATGRETVIAIDAGNLATLAAAEGRPDAGDCVAADNDNGEKPGARFGQRTARLGRGHRAALATGLPFYMPPLPGKDFNDLGPLETAVIFARPPLSATPVFDAWELAYPESHRHLTAEQVWLQLAQAEHAPEAAVLALTTALKLAPLAPHRYSLAAIRERLEHALARAPARVHPVTLDGIMARLEKRQADAREEALRPVVLPDVAGHHHERPAALPAAPDTWQGVVVVKAPMGSGKTQRLGRPLIDWAKRQGSTAVAIVHRRSLARELAARLALLHYRDLDDSSGPIEGAVTCLPSIVKDNHAPLRSAAVVFIDEFTQVIDFLESKDFCRTRWRPNRRVYDTLQAVIKRAGVVVVADADMNQRALAFLEACRPAERFKVIEVPEPRDAKIDAVYQCDAGAPEAAVGVALQEVASGGRPWIAVESKGRAQQIQALFDAHGFTALCITADSGGNVQQAAFLANPEIESLKYQAIIASPIIGSGISIEHRDTPVLERFTLGVYIGGGFSTTPAEACQQLRRVRYLQRFHLALVPNHSAVGHQDGMVSARALHTLARIEGDAPPEIAPFDALVCAIRTGRSNARAHFAAGLLWQLERAGWTLRHAGDSADPALSAELKEAREAVRARHWTQLKAAPHLSDEEVGRLQSREYRTDYQTICLEAHRIREALGLHDGVITDEALEVWDEGAGLARLDRFSAWQGSLVAADERDLPLTTRRFHAALSRAYSWLLRDTDPLAGLRLADAERILDRILEQRHLLAALGVVGPKFSRIWSGTNGKLKPLPRPRSAMKEVGEVFRRLGLKLHAQRLRSGKRAPSPARDVPDGTKFKVQTPPSGTSSPVKKPSGTPLERVYRLDPSTLAQVGHWAAQRHAHHRSVPEPDEAGGVFQMGGSAL